MPCYVAFDTETSNRFSDRMSAIDISVIENGVVAGSYYSLASPETHFDYSNIQLTGISVESMWHVPTFPKVQEEIALLMESRFLVTYNAMFDMSVLRKCLNTYGIARKSEVPYLCTVQMGKRLLFGTNHKLNAFRKYYGIELSHHKADSDSRAYAEILLHYLESGASLRPFIHSCSLQFREI